MVGLHLAGHRHVESGEAHVEADEREHQRQNPGVRQHVARGPARLAHHATVLALHTGTLPGDMRAICLGGETGTCHAHIVVVTVHLHRLHGVQHRRLRGSEREEDAADRAGGGRHEQLRNGVHRCGERGGENGAENEHDLVDRRFERIRGVEQIHVVGAFEQVGPSGAHECAERELGGTHDHGEHEQQWDRHAGKRREGEGEHDNHLHGERDTAHLHLAEAVEQARVERGHGGDGQNVDGAHRTGHGPVVVQMIEREHDPQAHHRHRQAREGGGEAKRLGPLEPEEPRVRRARALCRLRRPIGRFGKVGWLRTHTAGTSPRYTNMSSRMPSARPLSSG